MQACSLSCCIEVLRHAPCALLQAQLYLWSAGMSMKGQVGSVPGFAECLLSVLLSQIEGQQVGTDGPVPGKPHLRTCITHMPQNIILPLTFSTIENVKTILSWGPWTTGFQALFVVWQSTDSQGDEAGMDQAGLGTWQSCTTRLVGEVSVLFVSSALVFLPFIPFLLNIPSVCSFLLESFFLLSSSCESGLISTISKCA